MLNIFDSIKSILGEAAAKQIITILITEFNFYISTEEIQTLNIKL